jgi:hypothetical protein
VRAPTLGGTTDGNSQIPDVGCAENEMKLYLKIAMNNVNGAAYTTIISTK